MQPIDFKSDAPGNALKTPQDYWVFVPNPLSPCRREAVLSGRIEGTQASHPDLFFVEASGQSEQTDVREVANYVHALEYGLKRCR